MNVKHLQLKFSLAALLSLLCSAFAPSVQASESGRWVSGITEPINDVTMSFPVIGIIGAKLVEEGDAVKKGQVVMELDKRQEELEVTRRKLVKDLAKTELDRVRSLSERNAISVSREELDKKLAEFNISTVEHELASEQLRKRLLAAPFDGYITDVFLEVGESCQAEQPVVRIVDTRHCYLINNIEAKAGARLKVGQKVRLEVEAGDTPFLTEGTIRFISPVVDPASGLLKIKVVFENPEGQVRPGVAGKMWLEESAHVQ